MVLDSRLYHRLFQRLSKYGIGAKKSLGQHFLVDEKVLDDIVQAVLPDGARSIVEVGAGPGILTERLLALKKPLWVLELDERMMPLLRDMCLGNPDAHVVHTDVLRWEPPRESYAVVANIPYYITSPILRHFLLDAQQRPRQLLLLVQYEIAQKICDIKKPGFLSWMVRIFAEPKLLRRVPSASFYPAPKVESAVLDIRLFDTPMIPEAQIKGFIGFLHKAYRQPRKTLRNNLKDVYPLAVLDVGAALSLDLRPHQLTLDQWQRLYLSLSS